MGGSTAMREMFARLARIAATDSTVLLQGETGTGKELVAQAIHESSSRAEQPFIVVDCAALPENLLEAELFGHAKGAFTGASAARIGALEQASGGSVFLDEIGELPLSMQPKLLRVLESRTVRRIGESTYRNVDVRFITATHRDLRTMVNAGAFREDLFFRLAVLPVAIPPLRSHLEDLEMLIAHFAPDASRDWLTPQRLAELRARPWSGNVRELRNLVERLVALGPDQSWNLTESAPFGVEPPTSTDALPALPVSIAQAPFKVSRERWIDHFEREYIRQLLVRHGGNVTAASQTAGVDRAYVYRLLNKHRL
jgi:transcriptional regulator with GAF, ATPase, and Fis domain